MYVNIVIKLNLENFNDIVKEYCDHSYSHLQTKRIRADRYKNKFLTKNKERLLEKIFIVR